MATQGGTSRLALMQMKFQQKQQQEREQRKLEMMASGAIAANASTGGGVVTKGVGSGIGSSGSTSRLNGSVTKASTITMTSTKATTRSSSKITTMESSSESKSLSSSIGPGKVRQMFDERRQRGTGIDKSYPLKPLAARRTSSGKNEFPRGSENTGGLLNSTSVGSRSTGTSKVTTAARKTPPANTTTLKTRKVAGMNSLHKGEDEVDLLNGNESFGGNIPGKLPNVGKLTSFSNNSNSNLNNGNTLLNDAFEGGDRNNNSNTNLNNSRTPSNNSIKLKPIVTKKTVLPNADLEITGPKALPKKKPTNGVSVNQRRSPPTSSPASTIALDTNFNNDEYASENSISATSLLNSNSNNSSSRPTSKSSNVKTPTTKLSSKDLPENMTLCHYCNRNFIADRIQKHQEICGKTHNKKRKVFDISKRRLKGTEAEVFLKKTKGNTLGRSSSSTTDPQANINAKKSTWKKKHEEFIKAIRAAKEVQAHLAKGGKLSDLPPPAPSENPDYVQCPHCKRRFNEAAAARHIPKCPTMQHNKPKPASNSATARKSGR